MDNQNCRIWHQKNFDVHINFLKHYSTFLNEVPNRYLKFDYYFNVEEIKKLCQNHGLEQLKRENELETIIYATNWVNKCLITKNKKVMDLAHLSASSVIEKVINESVGVNCKTYSLVLKDVLLSLGILNRSIICKPIDYYFSDCHVVNIVYSMNYNKWLLFDATQNVYYTNRTGEILSLQELRHYFIEKKEIVINRIALSDDKEPMEAVYNVEKVIYNRRIKSYMAKNLFRFSCMQCCNLRNKDYNGRIYEYNLVPNGYIELPFRSTLSLRYNVQFVEWFIGSEEFFWSLPSPKDFEMINEL